MKGHSCMLVRQKQIEHRVQEHVVDACREELLPVGEDLGLFPHDDIIQRHDLKGGEVEATVVSIYEWPSPQATTSTNDAQRAQEVNQIGRLAARRDNPLLEPVLDCLILCEAMFLVEEEVAVKRDDLDAVLIWTDEGWIVHVEGSILLRFGFRSGRLALRARIVR